MIVSHVQSALRRSLFAGVNRSLLFSTAAPDVQQQIDQLVKKSKVVVFMKGVPEEPRCGFSNAVVQVFRMHGVPYDAHNVLADDSIRNGIKEYSGWPTIPQIFIDSKFIGGCDIIVQMHQNGELIETLRRNGIISELLKTEQLNKPKE